MTEELESKILAIKALIQLEKDRLERGDVDDYFVGTMNGLEQAIFILTGEEF